MYYVFFYLMAYGVHRTVSNYIYEFFYNNSSVFQALDPFLVSNCFNNISHNIDRRRFQGDLLFFRILLNTAYSFLDL